MTPINHDRIPLDRDLVNRYDNGVRAMHQIGARLYSLPILQALVKMADNGRVPEGLDSPAGHYAEREIRQFMDTDTINMPGHDEARQRALTMLMQRGFVRRVIAIDRATPVPHYTATAAGREHLFLEFSLRSVSA